MKDKNFIQTRTFFYVCNGIPMVFICDTKNLIFINLLDGWIVHSIALCVC